MKPLRKLVLVEPKQEKKVSDGGIYFPDSAKKEKQITEGTVKKLGNKIPNDCLMSVGDKIIFGKYAGHEVKHNDKDYILLKADKVMAIVKEE